MRLSQIGYDVGLLPWRNFSAFQTKRNAIETELIRLCETYYEGSKLIKILSRPETKYNDLPHRKQGLSDEVILQIEIAAKYAGYIERQETDVLRQKNLEGKKIPEDFDYSTVPSLRLEARQKLAQIRPQTIGQATRISGVSPADIGVLLGWLKRASEAKNKNTVSSDNSEICGGEKSN